jgi:hypothetical protein
LEAHHILPKARDLFPEYTSFKDNPWNKVRLTTDQHIIAHVMLWKAYGGSQAKALECMLGVFNSNTNKNLSNRKIPTKFVRRYLAKAREDPAKQKRTRTLESRLRQSERMTGVSSGPKSEAHKKALSESLLGKKHTEERRRNQSLAKKGKPLSPEHREAVKKATAGKGTTPEAKAKSELTRKTNIANGKIHAAKGKGWSEKRRAAQEAKRLAKFAENS